MARTPNVTPTIALTRLLLVVVSTAAGAFAAGIEANETSARVGSPAEPGAWVLLVGGLLLVSIRLARRPS